MEHRQNIIRLSVLGTPAPNTGFLQNTSLSVYMCIQHWRDNSIDSHKMCNKHNINKATIDALRLYRTMVRVVGEAARRTYLEEERSHKPSRSRISMRIFPPNIELTFPFFHNEVFKKVSARS